MKMYCCQPVVTKTMKSGQVSFEIPTFYLHPNVQGCLTIDDVQMVVESICNPTGNKNLTVSPNVTEVEVSE